ncbi:MAG: NAD(P)(+) transhydrogenase (Re/Si-specific) subunit beta [Thermoleophilia bacterium]|nr:NAD(P)(+) transhydrogenase (Re/Si-specific) subunit beta [Thermoleophilia bacterium]
MVAFAFSENTVNLAYVFAAVCFVFGIKMLSSPTTARWGNRVSAAGMLVAVAFTLTLAEVDRYWLVAAGLALGAVLGAPAARLVKMTAMPQMVALLNGAGGGAAALVASAEFHRLAPLPGDLPADTLVASLASALIGGVTLSGSIVAFAKLQELVSGRPVTFQHQQAANAAVLAVALLCAVAAGLTEERFWVVPLVGAALVFGVLFVIPIGGADMPVVIAVLNAFSGLSGVAAGFVLDNNALIIGGTLVGASGTLLTLLMARAMGRSVANVVFGAFGQVAVAPGTAATVDGAVRATTPDDVAVMLAYAKRVVIVPGYGLAVAQAQHDVRKLADELERRRVDVRYAIHPVAGRMPGHMNVLLAEANVPYDQLYEMDRINPEFEQVDVALVVGANDVTNPAARNEPGSPIYGMPILDVDHAKSVVVLKRSMNPGFAGIDNPLYADPKTAMLFGDAKVSVAALVDAVKSV